MRKTISRLLLLSAFVPAARDAASASRPGPTAAKRPMTFEDMMQMKRLGETAVSPDGKWLAYSVTTVNLEAEHQDSGVVAAGDCGR